MALKNECPVSSEVHQDNISLMCGHRVARLISLCHMKIVIIALQLQHNGYTFFSESIFFACNMKIELVTIYSWTSPA